MTVDLFKDCEWLMLKRRVFCLNIYRLGSLTYSISLPSTVYSWSFPPQQQNYPYQDTNHARKRALLIGINYFQQRGNFGELKGPINDAIQVREFLIRYLLN